MVKSLLALGLMLTINAGSFALPLQATPWSPAPKTATETTIPKKTKAPPAFDQLRQEGFESLHAMDYAAAQTKFEEMVKLAPTHPAGYFYLATNQWLSILYSMRRLQIGLYNSDSFYTDKEDKVEPQLDRQFRAAIQKAIEVAKARLAEDPKDVEGLYYMGAAYGTLGGYEASVTRKWRPAMSNGSEGVKYHKQVVELDPTYADAYLSIGLYHYIVGSLPWPVRIFLAVGGVRGSKKQGLQELQTAATKGKYASDDARTMLIALHAREGKHEEALKLLEELSAKYPQNYLYNLERAATLGRLGRYNESYRAFEEVAKNERARLVADLIHYQYGEALMQGSEFSRAAEQFEKATKVTKANAALVTQAHLRQGQALDAAGQRKAALAQYQIVLKREDVFDAHDQAQKYLKKPYTVEKPAPAEKKAED